MKINGTEFTFNSLSLENLKKLEEANKPILELAKTEKEYLEKGLVYEYTLKQVTAFIDFFKKLDLAYLTPEKVEEPILLLCMYQEFISECSKQKESYKQKYLGK